MGALKVLVANRGEIACRILHTLRELGLPSVALYTDVDAEAPHVWQADEAVGLGAPMQYLDGAAILRAAAQTGATAVHPGYGFLSQQPRFAADCAAAGLLFIGPSPEAMAALGDKRRSRAVAEACGIPVVPGAEACDDVAAALAAATRVGYPVLLKAAGGGGGKGMRRVDAAEEMAAAFAAAQREAQGAFADGRLLLEKYIHPARHIEVQVLGDGQRAVALGERECSLQRRYQKVIEEGPAACLTAPQRQALRQAAERLMVAAGYANAGTVEFLLADDGAFYFLEVNTRLQVEHPVTELTTGLDLVAWQLAVAQGAALPAPPPTWGHAIEARLNAEDVPAGFLPASGRVAHLTWPQWPHVRVDTGIAEGSVVGPHYDPLLAKLIAWGSDREQARRRLVAALYETQLLGVTTNQAFLLQILTSDDFIAGHSRTTTLEGQAWPAPPAPPAYALQAAHAGPVEAAGGAGIGTALAATPSPWDSLGGFRMGPCGAL